MNDKKKNWFARHKVLTVILGIVVLIIIAGAAGGGADTDTTNNSNESTESNASESDAAPVTAKIGEAARDGKFEFTVTSFECGATTLGTNEYLQEDAQGQFCVMAVTVKNIGNESQTFLSSDQKVLNAEGQEFSNDTAAELAINDSDVWLNEINPGNTAKGKVVFDVPADTSIVKAMLHDSSFSDGVEVTLK